MSKLDITPKARQAQRHIRNFIFQTGKAPSIPELMNAMDHKSPPSATLLVQELAKSRFLQQKKMGVTE